MVKNILGRVFTVWGAIVFIVSMVVFIPAVWVTDLYAEPKRTASFMQVVRIWMAVFFTLSGVRLRILGRDHFKKGANYIVVCNHNSMMDVPLSSPGIPGANKTIAKIEMAKVPVFSIIYKRGSVLLDRKSDASKRESYLAMKNVLENGMHMCIYPEGTRNKSEHPLKPFQDGAFRLSFDTGKKIIPCVIRGTRKMLPHNKTFFFWPCKVSMEFLPAIDPKDFASAGEMKEFVFNLMWESLEKRMMA